MNQNYQTRISPQICKVQTDRKLIAVYDQLKCAALTHYAQIHAKGEYKETDHKVNSLIKVTIQDYSNGTGDKNVIAQFNLASEQIQFIFTRITAGFQEFEWFQSKIYGTPDAQGYSTAQQFSISRHACDPSGRPMKSPWRIQIVNGKGVKVQNQKGGSYMKSGSFLSEKNAFIQLTDMDLYTLLKRTDSYITNWESCMAPSLIFNGKQAYGETGEEITHNLPAYQNVPLSIPYRKRLVITGESYIHTNDFERLKETLTDSNGKRFRNARNLVSGTVRNLNPETCAKRCVYFSPFNVLEGLEENPYSDSRQMRLLLLKELGFDTCPYISIEGAAPEELVTASIDILVTKASKRHIPIDGIVAIFDSFSYSKSCGKTGHHYKDGLAYKFEDEQYETIFRKIEWTPTRFGEIAPVGIFDTVEVDGCEVSRASLHNLSFIKNLELIPGCRILISKRNMIIPHIEENLDRGRYQDTVPPLCPCCQSATWIKRRKTSDGRIVETVHCNNPACDSQNLRKFEHFVSKKAMNMLLFTVDFI